jgi:hypothetical protein
MTSLLFFVFPIKLDGASPVANEVGADPPDVPCEHVITIERQTNSVLISFPPGTGHFYQVQESTDLMNWTNIWFLTGESSNLMRSVSTIGTQQRFFRSSSVASSLVGEWVCQDVDNRYHMQIGWNAVNQAFEGVLTTLGEWSAYVGFSNGEYVWTNKPTSDAAGWIERQKWRVGANGQSTSNYWLQGYVQLSTCTNPILTTSFTRFSKLNFPFSDWAPCLIGEWESQAPDNSYRMRVRWNGTNQVFEGTLTRQGQQSAGVGFSTNELIWAATPNENPKFWSEAQKYRTGTNGMSTGFYWRHGTLNIDDCTDSMMRAAFNSFVRVSN